MPPKSTKSTPTKSSSAAASSGAAQKPLRRAGAAPPPKKPAQKAPAQKAPAEKAPAKEEKKEEVPAQKPEAPAKQMTIGQKQIAKVLIEDESREIRNEGKAVLLVDNENHIGARFLPYSGANVLEASDPSHMDAERIRMGVIGAVRFGKPIAIDLGDTGPDMIGPLESKFDAVQKGLLAKCMSREVCKRDVYESLLKDTDEPNYKVEPYYDFEEEISAKFMFIIIMKNMVYPKDFTKQFYTVTIDQQ